MKTDLKSDFPSVSFFSDVDWSALAQEYAPASQIMSFPEYLEIKAEEGDCPPYIFELAYFDETLSSLQGEEFLFPDSPGVHLNPSARFLSFDFDILTMVSAAHEGKVEVVEKKNVLSIYVDAEGEIRFHELTGPELDTLQALEAGVTPSDPESLSGLVESGLLISVS